MTSLRHHQGYFPDDVIFSSEDTRRLFARVNWLLCVKLVECPFNPTCHCSLPASLLSKVTTFLCLDVWTTLSTLQKSAISKHLRVCFSVSLLYLYLTPFDPMTSLWCHTDWGKSRDSQLFTIRNSLKHSITKQNWSLSLPWSSFWISWRRSRGLWGWCRSWWLPCWCWSSPAPRGNYNNRRTHNFKN